MWIIGEFACAWACGPSNVTRKIISHLDEPNQIRLGAQIILDRVS